jgi:hypothetical protein
VDLQGIGLNAGVSRRDQVYHNSGLFERGFGQADDYGLHYDGYKLHITRCKFSLICFVSDFMSLQLNESFCIFSRGPQNKITIIAGTIIVA